MDNDLIRLFFAVVGLCLITFVLGYYVCFHDNSECANDLQKIYNENIIIPKHVNSHNNPSNLNDNFTLLRLPFDKNRLNLSKKTTFNWVLDYNL